MGLDDCRLLKKAADDCRRKIDRLAGAEERILADLKALGLPDLKAAEAEVARLREEVSAAQEKAERAAREFREKWGERLGLV